MRQGREEFWGKSHYQGTCHCLILLGTQAYMRNEETRLRNEEAGYLSTTSINHWLRVTPTYIEPLLILDEAKVSSYSQKEPLGREAQVPAGRN